MKLNRYIFMVLILCASPVWGQTAPIILSLQDALVLAQKNDIDILVANERIHQTLARLGQARSAYLPQITASAYQNRQTRDLTSGGFSVPGTGNLIGPFNSYDARIHLTQALFDPAAYERIKAAVANREVSQKQYAKTRQDVLALVATLYIDAWRAQEEVAVAASIIKRDMRKLNLQYVRSRQGLSSELDLLKAKTAYAESLTRWKKSIKTASENRLDLLAALKIPYDQRIIIKDMDDKSLEGELRNIDEVLSKHPDVVLAKEMINVRQKELQAEKKEGWPKLHFAGDYGASGTEPDQSSETYALGVQASMPIWEGGLRQAKIKEAKSRLNESKLQADDITFKTQANIINSLKAIDESKSLMSQLKYQMKVANQQKKIALNNLELGTGKNESIWEINTIFISTQDEAQEALATLWMARINLAHALGEMDKFLENLEH